MHKYKSLGRVGEGTFSEVLKAQSIKTGQYLAIKCMKHVFESLEQVNHLREIQALRAFAPTRPLPLFPRKERAPASPCFRPAFLPASFFKPRAPPPQAASRRTTTS